VHSSNRGDARLKIKLLNELLEICRLDPDAPVPVWTHASSGFVSITRTADELSIVLPAGSAPAGVRCEGGWSVFKLQGPFDFALAGILASVLGPLAAAGIPILAISTFDTDYVLVKEENAGAAARALEAAGHELC